MSVFKLINSPNDFSSIIIIVEYLSTIENLVANQLNIFKDKYKAHEALKKHLLKEYKIELPSIHNVGLYDAIESIIRLFKLDKNNPFIQKFLDICNASQENDNLEFIQWWEEKKTKTYISSPQNINAVQLLTIHKSKGLEFPVVIFPFANKSKGNQENLIWTKLEGLSLDIPFSIVNHVKALKDSTLSKAFEEEQESILLDDLNNVYVCLTRASEELYIFGKDSKKRKTSEIDSIESFFYPVLENLETDNSCYFLGEKQQKKTTPLQENLNKFKVNENQNWKDKIKLSFNAPTIWNVPVTTEDEFIAKDPRKYGNLIHSIFARISKTVDLPKVLEKMINEGLIEKSSVNDVSQTVSKVLNLSFIQENWNSGSHLIEQEIITKDGKSYRPDRIITFKNSTLLIDFKTGEKSRKDERQLENYAALLVELNYPNVSKHLIYLNPLEIVTVA